MDGKSNVVCFKNMASRLITNSWYANRNADVEEESKRIVRTAAKIIVSELRSTEFNISSYPTNEQLSDLQYNQDWLPEHLKIFLETMMRNPLHQASIGQSIVHASRPRSTLPPILYGLAVDVDHVFGSKWSLNVLHRLGYSLSYVEVTRYKQSVVSNEDLSDFLKQISCGSVSQWSADNVDHNVRTLDGKGSLHAMGMIISTTGSTNFVQSSIPRQKIKKSTELIQKSQVEILPYVQAELSSLSRITFKPLLHLQSPFTLAKDTMLDLIWHSAYFLRDPHPSWNGYMTDASNMTDAHLQAKRLLICFQ